MKNKTMKKLMTFVLCMVMILTCIPTTTAQAKTKVVKAYCPKNENGWRKANAGKKAPVVKTGKTVVKFKGIHGSSYDYAVRFKAPKTGTYKFSLSEYQCESDSFVNDVCKFYLATHDKAFAFLPIDLKGLNYQRNSFSLVRQGSGFETDPEFDVYDDATVELKMKKNQTIWIVAHQTIIEEDDGTSHKYTLKISKKK